MALEQIGIAPHEYDAKPEWLESGMRMLDAMMATWNAKGIRLGYPLPSSPEGSDLDAETEVNDAANEAIYLQLAIRMAPSFGRAMSPSLQSNAGDALRALFALSTRPIEQQITSLPAGAGHKTWRLDDDPFLLPATDNLLAGQDDELEFD